jgi:hypothetical protein
MSAIPFKNIESDMGKPVIVVEDQKFRQAFIKKNGEIRWRCTVKSCSARVFTDESISIILSGELDHIHETNAQKLERQILRTVCKRKAVDMMSERPSKIINSELFKMDEENLEKKNLRYVRQSMYRERRKLHRAQPKNQTEFHSILDDSVLCNNSESGIILFGCEANLKFLCTVSEEILLMEHINVVLSISSNYIRYMALRMVITFHWSSVLLPSKSEACYRKMFSLLDDSCKRFNPDLCLCF